MKEDGIINSHLDMEKSSIRMEISMKETGLTEKEKVMEESYSTVADIMKDNGLMINIMDRENLKLLTEELSMKEISLMEN